VGGSFNSTFQMKFSGPPPAAGVTFDDAPPASILLGGTVTVDDGTCSINAVTNSAHCDIGTLGVGSNWT
jgi:hypothetical protein